MPKQPRIINVLHKPRKCPVCGEQVVDIIYGTGVMTEVEFLYEYRQSGMMGGDRIPRRPPVWECACGCRRFRKVNPDGTDAPVKVKMLKDVRRKPLSIIDWETDLACRNLKIARQYTVSIVTELGEKTTLNIFALDPDDAQNEARNIIADKGIGLKGGECVSIEVKEK